VLKYISVRVITNLRTAPDDIHSRFLPFSRYYWCYLASCYALVTSPCTQVNKSSTNIQTELLIQLSNTRHRHRADNLFLTFFFKKNCSQHVILADVWLSPEGSSICPDAGVQRTILDDKMLINGWETVFNDLSIYRN
jgi:hypothetical protein